MAARRTGHAAPLRGVYHLAPPDHTSWHGFGSAEYPTPAARPAWSVLDARLLRETLGLALPPWRVQLSQCMKGGGA